MCCWSRDATERDDDSPFLRDCKRVVRRYRTGNRLISRDEFERICGARPAHATKEELWFFTYVLSAWYDQERVPKSERFVGWGKRSFWRSAWQLMGCDR